MERKLRNSIVENDIEKVKKTVEENSSELDKYTTEISECLVFASSQNKLEIVKFLSNVNGTELLYKNKQDRKDALQIAAKNNFPEILKFLLNHPNFSKNIEYISDLLCIAAENGSFGIVDYLLKSERDFIDVNYKERSESCCVLSKAAWKGEVSVVKLLLSQQNIDVHSCDKERTNVLMYAAMSNIEVLSMVLEKMKETENRAKTVKGVNKRDDNGYTAVDWLLTEGGDNIEEKLEMVKLLLEAGADINNQDNMGKTALMKASSKGYTPIVKYLMDVDTVRVNETDIRGNTAVMCASTDEVEGLLTSRPEVDVEGFRTVRLINTAARGNLEKVKSILDQEGPQIINSTDSLGNTALVAATRGQHVEVIRELLKVKNIDVNLKNHKKETPLIRAVHYQNLPILELLLSVKTLDINVTDNRGGTPLMRAVLKGDLPMVKLLLNSPDHTADITARDTAGNSALSLAHEFKHWEIVEVLMMRDSVLDNLDLTGKEKEANREIISDVGDRNNIVWELLLTSSKKRVLQLFILMSGKINGDRIEDQTGFWKYAFEHPEAKKYLKGEKEDERGYSLYHYCAETEDQSDVIKLLMILPIKYFPDLSKKVNENGDTMLHIALKCESIDVFHAVVDRLQPYNDYVCTWFSPLLKTKNNAKNTFLSIAIKLKDKIKDETIQGMLEKLRPGQLVDLCEATDRSDNTLIHLATLHHRPKLLTYLATQPIDVKHLNRSGFTALHMAVKENNIDALVHLHNILNHRGIDINEKTADGETAMHIAFKNGSKEMISKLEELGGELDSQDDDGNTPLHDLIQFIDLDTDESEAAEMETFRKVWNLLKTLSVSWWCNKFNKEIPDVDTSSYVNLRQEAMYYLRSEILNKGRMTVLEYAAAFGLYGPVQIMLTEKDAFILNIPPGQMVLSGVKYEMDVSNLMPEYYFNGQTRRVKEKEKSEKGTQRNAGRDIGPDETMVDSELEMKLIPDSSTAAGAEARTKAGKSEPGRTGSRRAVPPTRAPTIASTDDMISSSFLETLAKIKPPVKVSPELEAFPMELLARHQWYVYQVFAIGLLIFHTGLMIWYTHKSQRSITRSTGNLPQNFTTEEINCSSEDFAIMIYTWVFIVLAFASYIYYKILKRKQKTVEHRVSKFPDYIEAKGSIFNFLTYIVATIAEQFTKILFLVFGLGSLLLVVFTRHLEGFTAEHYVWIKGVVMLSGWLLVLVIGKAYSPIYNFVTILKYIFVKDMVPFLIFYVIMTVAFACAIQLQFQLLTPEGVTSGASEWLATFTSDVANVIWELFVMTAGLDVDLKGVQTIGQLFKENKYSSSYIELLLVLYGIASIVILLNMIIAAMNETYANVLQKQGKGWRQFQVKAAIQVRRLTFGVFDSFVRWIAGVRQDPDTKRWYLPIEGLDLKQIRARYWKNLDEGSENGENKGEGSDFDFEAGLRFEDLQQDFVALKNAYDRQEEKMDRLVELAEKVLKDRSAQGPTSE